MNILCASKQFEKFPITDQIITSFPKEYVLIIKLFFRFPSLSNHS